MGKIKFPSSSQSISHEVLVAVASASAVIPHTQEQKEKAELSRQVRMNDGE